ncbi:hypothetical protein RchiOBHm_Chr6g0251381 [Rosa chinensis]|uniref:Uncharacterized protein n=1 Tax=Rosa chinensis TaxID=74649 RepID=A0A2P6PKS5_ROSCH|nr:hypothetical protein RchiOBHm_Chr6g0251381 [Rosa chinensis]
MYDKGGGLIKNLGIIAKSGTSCLFCCYIEVYICYLFRMQLLERG